MKSAGSKSRTSPLMRDGKSSQANRVIDVFIKHGALPAVKEMMRMLGFDCGYCRRPLGRLDEDQVAALRADLDRIGFWEIADAAQ